MPEFMPSNRREREDRRICDTPLASGVIDRRCRPERRLPEVEIFDFDAFINIPAVSIRAA